MHVADELLRDGAGTAGIAHHSVLHGSSDTNQIDAVVLIETLIFDGHKRLAHEARQRGERNVCSHLFAKFTDDRTIAGQHDRGLWQRNDGRSRISGLRGERAGREQDSGETEGVISGHDAESTVLVQGRLIVGARWHETRTC